MSLRFQSTVLKQAQDQVLTDVQMSFIEKNSTSQYFELDFETFLAFHTMETARQFCEKIEIEKRITNRTASLVKIQ